MYGEIVITIVQSYTTEHHTFVAFGISTHAIQYHDNNLVIFCDIALYNGSYYTFIVSAKYLFANL